MKTIIFNKEQSFKSEIKETTISRPVKVRNSENRINNKNNKSVHTGLSHRLRGKGRGY